jgi:hypothetical protein
MATLTLRLRDSLHQLARKVAEEEGISMNQLITLALAEKVSALKTESYLQARAARGDRTRFEAALAKVADVEPPDERDRL